MKHSKFHGDQVPRSVNISSPYTSENAWRKVVKSGSFKNWMDYQKWVLAQVKPIDKYKKGI